MRPSFFGNLTVNWEPPPMALATATSPGVHLDQRLNETEAKVQTAAPLLHRFCLRHNNKCIYFNEYNS
jgi:hypothetical protein